MVTVLGQVGLPGGLNGRGKQHRSSGTKLGRTLGSRARTHLINDPACHTHPIENGHVDNSGHSSVVDGLRAVRPHVGTLCEVNVAGGEAGRKGLRYK